MDGNTVSSLNAPNVTRAEKRNTITLRLEGNLCYENTEDVMTAMESILSQSPEAILFEMDGVESIDSSGLRTLLQGRKMFRNAGITVQIGRISDSVARIMILSGLGQVFGLPQNYVPRKGPSPSCVQDQRAHDWRTYEYVAISDASLIAVLRQRAVDAAVEAGADADELCDIKIAVGEALTNAYRHGSPDKGKNKIHLRCTICTGTLIIEIEDEGKPFDPNSTKEPDPKQMKDHGMGLYLMRQAMDKVEFFNNCPGNRVRMLKRVCGKKFTEAEGSVESYS